MSQSVPSKFDSTNRVTGDPVLYFQPGPSTAQPGGLPGSPGAGADTGLILYGFKEAQEQWFAMSRKSLYVSSLYAESTVVLRLVAIPMPLCMYVCLLAGLSFYAGGACTPGLAPIQLAPAVGWPARSDGRRF